MGKLKCTDVSNITAYLSYDNTEIKSNIVIKISIFNMIIPYINMLYCDPSFLIFAVALIISVGCLVFIIYYKMKVLPTQKQINLYYAVSMLFMSVNLCYVSCVFFSQTFIGFLLPLVLLVLTVPFCVFFTIKTECKRINSGFHKDKKSENAIIVPITVAAAGLGVFASRLVGNQLDDQIILGVCCGILGIIFSFFSRFLVKWYCYRLLENFQGK